MREAALTMHPCEADMGAAGMIAAAGLGKTSQPTWRQGPEVSAGWGQRGGQPVLGHGCAQDAARGADQRGGGHSGGSAGYQPADQHLQRGQPGQVRPVRVAMKALCSRQHGRRSGLQPHITCGALLSPISWAARRPHPVLAPVLGVEAGTAEREHQRIAPSGGPHQIVGTCQLSGAQIVWKQRR